MIITESVRTELHGKQLAPVLLKVNVFVAIVFEHEAYKKIEIMLHKL